MKNNNIEFIKKLTKDIENNLKPTMNIIFNGGPNSLTDQTLNTIDIELIILNTQIKNIFLNEDNSFINYIYNFNGENYPPIITYSHMTDSINRCVIYTL